MHDLTSGLPTKAAKIRTLDGAGYPRARIADFLGISYQHVRNVLQRVAPTPAVPTDDDLRPGVPQYGQAEVDESGAVHLPREVFEHLGFRPDRRVGWRLEGDEVVLMSAAAGLRRAQAALAKYAKPGEEPWVDQFLRDRRAMWGEDD
jgi:antitoxin component of MazEF toxin-antitoxin module